MPHKKKWHADLNNDFFIPVPQSIQEPLLYQKRALWNYKTGLIFCKWVIEAYCRKNIN